MSSLNSLTGYKRIRLCDFISSGTAGHREHLRVTMATSLKVRGACGVVSELWFEITDSLLSREHYPASEKNSKQKESVGCWEVYNRCGLLEPLEPSILPPYLRA